MQQPSTYRSPFARLPAAVPPAKHPLRRLAILSGVIAGLIVLACAGIYLYLRFTPQHRILIDNANEFSVTVELDGERLQIGPRSAATVRVSDGELAIHATGPGLDEHARLAFPAAGWRTAGRTGLYNVGGGGRLAVVTVTYGMVFDGPRTFVLPAGKGAVLLPSDVTGEIDEAFPPQVETHGSGAVLRHVCHVEGERFKCAGSNASDPE